MLTRQKIIYFCLSLWLLLSILGLKTVKFDNYVWFEGDTWEYQSMAVNWAQGKQLMTVGAFGDYQKDYKFRPAESIFQPQIDYLRQNGKQEGNFSFYRTPGYILFVGLIYKIFGVSPLMVKQIQLILIAFITAFMPLMGFVFWRKQGLIGGILAGLLYFEEYAKNLAQQTSITYPAQIMTEILIAFWLFIWVWSFIYWQKKTNVFKSLVLGLTTGVSLLIKGSNIFLPILVSGYLMFLGLKKKLSFNHLLAYILGVVLLITPYSIYATKKAGKFILLSTQSEAVILGGNNEFALDGQWHREGFRLNDEQTFYGRAEVRNLSLPAKLVTFYRQNSQLFPKMLLNRIASGFYYFKFFHLTLMLMIYYQVNKILEPFLKKKKMVIQLSSLVIVEVLGLLLIGLTLTNVSLVNGWGGRIIFLVKQILRTNFLLLTTAVVTLIAKLVKGKQFELDLPTPLLILFLNYLLITLISFGLPRFIQVIDFVFILLAMRYALRVLEELKKTIKVKFIS